MSRSSSPAVTPGTASPAAPDASGYLLLTIQHAQVKQIYDGETMILARGELRLECVSLPIPPEIGHQTANPFSPSTSDPAVPTHDFWLVLRVGPTFEFPLIPEQEFRPQTSPDGITYSVASPHVQKAFCHFVLPSPSSSEDMEDLESFEVLLRQYKCLGVEATALGGISTPLGAGNTLPMADELRGRLMLINEDNGEIVGELDQSLDADDDKQLAEQDRNKPVMVDFGNVVDGYAPIVKVQTVPQDELDDWMLLGAHKFSKGVLSFSSWSSKIISSGADSYIRNSTPRAEPVKFSPAAKTGIRTAHNASVKTVKVTKSTVGVINRAISSVVEKGYEKGVAPVVETYQEMRVESRRGSMPSEMPRPQIYNDPRRSSMSGQAPALPPRSSNLSGNRAMDVKHPVGTPPPVPRKPASLKTSSATSLPLQSKVEDRDPLSSPPAYGEKMTSGPGPIGGNVNRTPTSAPASYRRPFLNRLLLAGEVVLTSLEHTAQELITSTTDAASSAAGHKYGAEAGQATALLGGSVRNVAVVYIDVRGVGRRALLKSSAKGFVKARMKNGKVVKLQGEGRKDEGVEVIEGEVDEDPEGELVVGMQEVGMQNRGTSSALEGRQDDKGLTRR